MTQYKLIKTKDQFIIVSNDDAIVKGNLYYNTRLQNVYEAIANSGYNTVDKEFKVIAQQNQIDFNGFEDIVGYVDIEKLAYQQAEDKYPMTTAIEIKLHTTSKLSYQEGFNKANELSNKLFTLEDVTKAFNKGFKCAKSLDNPFTIEKEFIQSLEQPKEWMIEIAMKEVFTGIISGGLNPIGEIGSKGLVYHTELEPKLINNKIKITKIL